MTPGLDSGRLKYSLNNSWIGILVRKKATDL